MLEFNCPYCTASIRVGLEAAGKVGRCPKCETKIRVPELPEDAAVEAPAPATIPPMEVLSDEVLPPPTGVPVAPTTAAQSITAATGWTPPVDPDSPLERLRRKRRQGSPLAALIPPAIFGVLLIVGIGGFWWWNQPSYSGSMLGTVVQSDYSLAAELAGGSLGAPTGAFHGLMQELFQQPVDLRSSVINLRYLSDGQSLTILIRPGLETKLVQVPLTDNRWISKFYAGHHDQLNGYRLDELQSALKKVCTDWQDATNAGRELETLPNYRETLAINAHVQGLGRICEALVGNERYPCVAEDSLGRLIFLVPADAKSFSIRERPASELGHASQFSPALDIKVTITEPEEQQSPASTDDGGEPAEPIPYIGDEPMGNDSEDGNGMSSGDEEAEPGMATDSAMERPSA
ncbi:MAG: hypothetical protein KDA58_01600 [Planctomycetaceae bacterium]|nr:hypothetical protein [Planctomycetaceae bacterium]